MQPQQPPSPLSGPLAPVSWACALRLEQMERVAEDLAVAIQDGDGSCIGPIAAHLQTELHAVVAELAREDDAGRLLLRSALEGTARQLEQAGICLGWWPSPRTDCPSPPHESAVRAAILRLRLVARN